MTLGCNDTITPWIQDKMTPWQNDTPTLRQSGEIHRHWQTESLRGRGWKVGEMWPQNNTVDNLDYFENIIFAIIINRHYYLSSKHSNWAMRYFRHWWCQISYLKVLKSFCSWTYVYCEKITLEQALKIFLASLQLQFLTVKSNCSCP
jgi:hypothetical protein